MMRVLLIAVVLAAGCASSPRVDPAGRPLTIETDPEPRSIFIPVEKQHIEICVEREEEPGEFTEDCIEAGDLHALLRATGQG